MRNLLALLFSLFINTSALAGMTARIELNLTRPTKTLALPLLHSSLLLLPQLPRPLIAPVRPVAEVSVKADIHAQTAALMMRRFEPLVSKENERGDRHLEAQKTHFDHSQEFSASAAVFSDAGQNQAIVDGDYAGMLEAAARSFPETGDINTPPLPILAAMKDKDARVYFHMMRVGGVSGLLAFEMGHSPTEARQAAWAGRLHDMGKMDPAIDALVNKQGPLTEEERKVIGRHPEMGAEFLFARKDIPHDIRWAGMKGALYHHEMADGSGYPRGLKKEDIPMEARITTVADHFDALLENRPYRKAMSMPEALKILEREKAKFDPRVWEALLRLAKRFSSQRPADAH